MPVAVGLEKSQVFAGCRGFHQSLILELYEVQVESPPCPSSLTPRSIHSLRELTGLDSGHQARLPLRAALQLRLAVGTLKSTVDSVPGKDHSASVRRFSRGKGCIAYAQYSGRVSR